MKFSAILAVSVSLAFAVAEPLPPRVAHAEVREVSAAASTPGKVTASALLCRTCPKTSCTALRQYNKGTTVHATCAQYTGTTVVEGDPYWDKTTDGCWVAEYYLSFSGSYPPDC